MRARLSGLLTAVRQSLHTHTGWWLLLAALIVTALAYAPGLSGSWLFDDYPNIVDNPGVHMDHVSIASLTRAALSSPSSMFHRPLSSITFAFNYLADGLHPFWWKVTNVGIHLVNGLLVFLLARLLLQLGLPVIRWRADDGDASIAGGVDRRHVAILAAIIAGGWMLLPINLTAVLYVVQRMASLANVFVLLGLIGYVAGRMHMLDAARSHAGGFVLCVASLVVCTAVGFAAKETAVMLPLYAFLIECVLFRFRARSTQVSDKNWVDGKSHRREWLVVGLFVVILLLPFIVGLVWLWPRTFAAGTWASRDFTLDTRLLSEARIVCGYIVWTLLPTPDALSFYHDGYPISAGLLSPWTTLVCIILIAILIGWAVWLRKRAPLVALGVLLFFGAQTLTATVLPLELVYEHRNYFASFGLLLALVPILAATRGTSWRDVTSRLRGSLPLALPRYVLLVGLLLLWVVQTSMTAYAWGDSLRLAQALAARAPHSPRAQYSLGRTYIVYSHYDPDSIFTRAAYAPLERAAALPHSSILPEQALIFMNARLHRPIKEAWWDSMIAKLKDHDPGVQDISSLGALTTCARDGGCQLSRTRMVEAFLAALDHPHPSSRLLAIYSDYAWNVLGDHALGERMAAEAVKYDPGEPAYHITLARMLAVDGRFDGVRKQIKALERLNIGGRLNGSIAGVRLLLPTASSQ
ncbi:MAG TPA: hypothetical protein VF269_08930 [Rhodanobacteraceae bacterium]